MSEITVDFEKMPELQGMKLGTVVNIMFKSLRATRLSELDTRSTLPKEECCVMYDSLNVINNEVVDIGDSNMPSIVCHSEPELKKNLTGSELEVKSDKVREISDGELMQFLMMVLEDSMMKDNKQKGSPDTTYDGFWKSGLAKLKSLGYVIDVYRFGKKRWKVTRAGISILKITQELGCFELVRYFRTKLLYMKFDVIGYEVDVYEQRKNSWIKSGIRNA